MKKILLTYFEPFNGNKFNTSETLISKLTINDSSLIITKKKLKVTYSNFNDIKDELDPNYDFIFLFGECNRDELIGLEARAKNLMNSLIKDNDGVIKSNEKIIDTDDISLKYLSSSYSLNILIELTSKYNDSYLSFDAGGYICNSTYYNFLLSYKNKNTKILFIHLSKKIKGEEEILTTIKNIINDLINS